MGMLREDIINQIKNDFGYTIKDFVSKDYYNLKKENAWDSLDVNLLETFLVILKNKSADDVIVINDWSKHPDSQYNSESVFKYSGFRNGEIERNAAGSKATKSAHLTGRAFDLKFNKKAEYGRQFLFKIQDKLPYGIRLEGDKTWVHIDMNNPNKTFTNSNDVKSGRSSIDGGTEYVKKIFKLLKDSFGYNEINIEN